MHLPDSYEEKQRQRDKRTGTIIGLIGLGMLAAMMSNCSKPPPYVTDKPTSYYHQ